MSNLLHEPQLKCAIITITCECRRPKFDVSANEIFEQEVLILRTPSCVAAADALILWSSSSHEESTHCSHTFRDILPLCPSIINTIDYVCARVDRALLQVLPSSNALALAHNGTRTSSTSGNIHRTLFRNSGPKLDIKANQPFQQEDLIQTPPCFAAPKSEDVCQPVRPSGRLQP